MTLQEVIQPIPPNDIHADATPVHEAAKDDIEHPSEDTAADDEHLVPYERLPRAKGPKLEMTPDEFKKTQERIQHDFPTLDPMANYFLTYMIARGAKFEAEPNEDGKPRVSVPDDIQLSDH